MVEGGGRIVLSDRITITISAPERKRLEVEASRAGLSLSAYLRQRLNLEPLAHGGRRRNAGRDRAIGFESATQKERARVQK